MQLLCIVYWGKVLQFIYHKVFSFETLMLFVRITLCQMCAYACTYISMCLNTTLLLTMVDKKYYPLH